MKCDVCVCVWRQASEWTSPSFEYVFFWFTTLFCVVCSLWHNLNGFIYCSFISDRPALTQHRVSSVWWISFQMAYARKFVIQTQFDGSQKHFRYQLRFLIRISDGLKWNYFITPKSMFASAVALAAATATASSCVDWRHDVPKNKNKIDSHNDSINRLCSLFPVLERQPFLNWLDRFHASFPSQTNISFCVTWANARFHIHSQIKIGLAMICGCFDCRLRPFLVFILHFILR